MWSRGVQILPVICDEVKNMNLPIASVQYRYMNKCGSCTLLHPPPPVMHHVTKQKEPVMFPKHDSSQSVHCSPGTQPRAGNLCSRTAECCWQICRNEVMQPCCDKPPWQEAHLTWSGCTVEAAGTQPGHLFPPGLPQGFIPTFKLPFYFLLILS